MSIASDSGRPRFESPVSFGHHHPSMDELAVRRAQRLVQQGMEAVSRGGTEEALEKFKASATEHATADAITYWGWMEHQLGNTVAAIELCEKAIQLDSEFGNPYNDIGSYLISLGREDEAIPWFEKAKLAARYEPRHFPYLNLGRVYLAKNMPLEALREFEMALTIVPDDQSIADIVKKLRVWRLSIN